MKILKYLYGLTQIFLSANYTYSNSKLLIIIILNSSFREMI